MIQLKFTPGDIVKVYQKIQEGDKTRTQIFEGTVLQIRGRGENKSFTVQKLVGPVAVERIWPIMSPNLVQVVKSGHILKNLKKVRRAKLNYLKVPKK